MTRWTDILATIVLTAAATSALWLWAGTERFWQWLGWKDDTPEQVEPAPPRPWTPPAPASPTRGAEPTVVGQSPPTGSRGGSGSLIIPVVGIEADQLVDTFGAERGVEGQRRHKGIDILAPRGTPVLAAASGKVESLFDSDAGGRTIYIRSDDRQTVYYYAHLARYARGLSEGDRVSRGERIANVGSTGNADPSAPHLHFEITRVKPDADWHEGGTSLNPYSVLTARAD